TNLGKPVGTDLLQGHPTLPTILFAAKHPQGADLKRALTGGDDVEEVKRVVALIPGTSVIEECYGIARSFSEQALKALEALPQGPATASLSGLAAYILDRRR
ncbi:MAG: hypothetical protein V3U31_02795, partial [Dehalococcoidia bacterium]